MSVGKRVKVTTREDGRTVTRWMTEDDYQRWRGEPSTNGKVLCGALVVLGVMSAPIWAQWVMLAGGVSWGALWVADKIKEM